MEYQRQQAKAMQQYFKSLKFADTVEKAKCVAGVGGDAGRSCCVPAAERTYAGQ